MEKRRILSVGELEVPSVIKLSYFYYIAGI
jgi:hypothetical protein